MKISPSLIVVIAVVLSAASAGVMLTLNYDALFKRKPIIKAEFTSVEFDADDTSYSPAETHSMNQLSKELAALKERLIERENELDARESAISMDMESLEKQKGELNQIREDLANHFPYKVVHMEGCEADDVIGALTIDSQEFGKNEPIMIISSDKDFIQLQRYSNVKQFSPIQKKAVSDPNPRKYLFEHILKGDKGDGIPNILSGDNTFVDEIRQSPMTAKKIEHFAHNADKLEEVMTTEEFRNFQRNKTLIDLHDIPSDRFQSIIDNYNNQKPAMRMKVLNYLVKNRCNNLIESVEEFYNG